MRLREQTKQMIHSITRNRKQRHRLMAMITALSVLTGGNVFWELRETGTAITSDQLCGKQAHEHSADCYDDSGTLKCGMDEHIHSNECFSDMKADVETPEIWEKTFAVSNEASKREQTVMIAETQLGYAESKNNFVISEDGKQQGYTRYGEWYGNAYGDWNTMFTYFCMYYAGVSEDEIPYGGNARTWQTKLIENKMLHPPDSEPCRGNIVLLDTDTDGKADRTGIISNTEDRLKIIEGDHDNAVAEVEYQLNDPQILGYVSLPEPEKPVEAEAVPITFSAESPSGIKVNASAYEGTFPPDAVMIVEDVSPEEALQTADDLAADSMDAVAVDISFYVDDVEVEPAADRKVQVQISLPDEMTLQEGDYSLLHVTDDGDVQNVEEADVSGTGAEFTADSFSVYVLTSEGYKDKDEVYYVNGQPVANSPDNPYIVSVGETFRVKTRAVSWTYGGNPQGYPYGVDMNILERTIVSNEFETEGQVTYLVCERDYKALKTGTATVAVVKDDKIQGGTKEYFYIKAVEPEIYVKSSFENKHIDRVKEWLDNSEAINVGGYVPNAKGKINDSKTEGRPYAIRVGDTFEIFAPGEGTFSLKHYNLKIDGSTNYNYITSDSNSEKISEVTGSSYSNGKTSAKYEGIEPGEVEITYTSQGYTRTMWVRVLPTNDTFNHADMEIADGGKYTITSTSYINGKKVTTLKVYDAFVSYVNSAELLDSSGAPLPMRAKDTGKYEYSFSSDTNDYKKIGEDGQTQYELTSAFGRAKMYNINDVKSALFDVKITLEPEKQCTITDGVAGQWEDLGGEDKIVESYKCIFDQQGIIDAINKCPMTNGLDFTIKANGAFIDIKATKSLLGGTLTDDQFTFQLLDDKGNVVATASNDKYGNIVFLDQMYTEPGTYHYKLHEVVNEGDESHLYDKEDKDVTVKVNETPGPDGITILQAEIEGNPEFTNYVVYRLPNTGGTGVLPYITAGTALITAAMLLFIRRRKRI